MAVTETLIFYVAIGLAVAAAVAMSARPRSAAARMFEICSAVPFWPLYVPVLLSGASAGGDGNEARPRARVAAAATDDVWAARIAEVEGELDEALASLDGWAEEALARERQRIVELRQAWRLQASRIGEMDRVLAANTLAAASAGITGAAVGEGSRTARSEQARRQNLARLGDVRQRACEDLAATLASVRELVSMIHQAKFTGAPAARADELVTQIAAAVEGLSEAAACNAAG